MVLFVPRDIGEFEETKAIKDVPNSSNTPLSFYVSKAKRDDKERQENTKKIKVVVPDHEVATFFSNIKK